MKIAVIGANGKLGSYVVKEALSRGHYVTGLVRNPNYVNPEIKIVHKNLFDIRKDDIDDFETVISCFGGGLKEDPTINRKAIDYLGNLVRDSNKHLIIVGGAGCLYCDNKHIMHIYESDKHPAFLKKISENIYLGYHDLVNSTNIRYTFVCPSIEFNYDEPKNGRYQVGTNLEPLMNTHHQSIIGYQDFASALVDEAEDQRYVGKLITICEI